MGEHILHTGFQAHSLFGCACPTLINLPSSKEHECHCSKLMKTSMPIQFTFQGIQHSKYAARQGMEWFLNWAASWSSCNGVNSRCHSTNPFLTHDHHRPPHYQEMIGRRAPIWITHMEKWYISVWHSETLKKFPPVIRRVHGPSMKVWTWKCPECSPRDCSVIQEVPGLAWPLTGGICQRTMDRSCLFGEWNAHICLHMMNTWMIIQMLINIHERILPNPFSFRPSP